MTPRSDCKSFHPLVSPPWAASFWRNAETLLKNGVRLVHQKSHDEFVIPSSLLRWSYGLAPDVSPPAKIDWRRGASRRRRRSNRGSSTEFLLSIGDAGANGGYGHADGGHDDDDAGDADDDDADDDADDDGIDDADDNDDSGRSIEHDGDHDGRHDDHDGGVHRDHQQYDGDDDDVDGHQAFDGNTLNTATPTRAAISTNTINTTTATTIVVIPSVLTYCFDSNLLGLRCFADFGYTSASSADLYLMNNSSGDLTADYG